MTDLTNRTQIIPAGNNFQSTYEINCYAIECAHGTHFDALNNVCSPCSASCLDCYNTTYCLNCTDSYYLQENTCILCSLAISNCLTCSVNSTLRQFNCTSCLSNYFLNPSN